MILTKIENFDQQRLKLVIYKIGVTKKEYDYIIDKEPGIYLKGRRWDDDTRIASIVLGEIYSDSNFDHKEANGKFLSLNSNEMEPYIKNAVLEAALNDYYYNNEKAWD